MEHPPPHPEAVMAVLKQQGPQPRIAVVGASNNPEKYGNIIVRNLAGKGYTVLPINPKEATIAELPAFASLAAVDPPIHTSCPTASGACSSSAATFVNGPVATSVPGPRAASTSMGRQDSK